MFHEYYYKGKITRNNDNNMTQHLTIQTQLSHKSHTQIYNMYGYTSVYIHNWDEPERAAHWLVVKFYVRWSLEYGA